MSSREFLRIVAVGHVDHGKSTVIGRLLYDTNSISDGVINKVKKVCEEDGKAFEYAFLLDAFEEEQKPRTIKTIIKDSAIITHL